MYPLQGFSRYDQAASPGSRFPLYTLHDSWAYIIQFLVGFWPLYLKDIVILHKDIRWIPGLMPLKNGMHMYVLYWTRLVGG